MLKRLSVRYQILVILASLREFVAKFPSSVGTHVIAFTHAFRSEFAQNPALQQQVELLQKKAKEIVKIYDYDPRYTRAKFLFREMAVLVFKETPYKEKRSWNWDAIETRALTDTYLNRSSNELDFFKALAEMGFTAETSISVRPEISFDYLWKCFSSCLESEGKTGIIRLFSHPDFANQVL